MKAKFVWHDGTETEMSDDTEQNLRDKFGKPKGFEPIKLCHLRINVSPLYHDHIRLWWETNETDYCTEPIGSIRRTIEAL